MLFKRGNIKNLFTSVRNGLASECPDVTLVCSDGRRLEAQGRMLSFLSPLLRSISSSSDSSKSQLLLLPDFSAHTVAGVVDLFKEKKKKGEEEVIKLTRHQIDLLSCLGVHLTNLEVEVTEASDQLGRMLVMIL